MQAINKLLLPIIATGIMQNQAFAKVSEPVK